MPFQTLKYIFMAVYALVITCALMLKGPGFKDAQSWIFGILYAISLCAVFIPIREKKIGSYSKRTPTVVLILLFSIMTACLVITANFAPSEYFSHSGYGKFVGDVLDKKFYLVIPVVWLVFLVPSLLLLASKRTERIYEIYLKPLLAASALNTVSSMIFHHFVMKRGGCFAGITSGIGVFCAFAIFLWVLGPSLFLYFLFLRKKYSLGKKG
jgi:hypothetical protein